MRQEDFTENRTGSVLTMPDGIAFLPNRLPPNFAPTMRLMNALGKARGALGEFVGQARLVENQELITHPLAIREAVLSNKIEGTHTTVAGVLLQRAGDLPQDPLERRDQAEVLCYFRALRLGAEQIENGWPLGSQFVRALHTQLLAEDPASSVKLGRYRTTQAYIGKRFADTRLALTEARYVPPPFEQIEPLVENLFSFMNGEPTFDPLIDCGIMHYQFEAIHPFEDGNGRMGRLLIPMYLMSQGIVDKPYLYLSSYFEANIDEYVDSLKAVSTHGAWEDWLVLFLEAVRSQSDESKGRVRTMLELYRDYKARVTAETRSQASLAAIDLIMKQVFVTARDVEEFASCSNPTARTALSSLEDLGIISPMKGVYPQRWVADELLNKIYKIN